jgi:hypothetical protein
MTGEGRVPVFHADGETCRLHDIADIAERRNSLPAGSLWLFGPKRKQEATLNGLIYLIGLIVVIMAILSFFGLR